MTNLIGLAFTSPQIAVMVCDRSKFRVHFYQKRPSELHSFLQMEDERLPVVLVTSVRDLARVQDVEGIHSILLFDEPEAMESIHGVRILDAHREEGLPGFRKVILPKEDLNDALTMEGSFSLTEDAKKALSDLSSEIRFRTLMKGVLSHEGLPDDFEENACLYLAGALPKRSWVSRCQKKALSSGMAVEKIAELERYIETASDSLWRSWYEVNEGGVPVKDASAQFGADLKDLQYIVKVLGSREDLKYSRNPRDTPLVVKKKRKKRKKTPSQEATRLQKMKGGPSVSSTPPRSTIDKKLLTKAQKESSMSSGYPLVSTLEKIDTTTSEGDVPYAFSRMACARLCGLVKTRKWNSSCKTAVSEGADPDDVESIRSFIEKDEEAQRIWKAYCRTSYTVGVSAKEASEEFDVPLSKLNAVLAYKPMAYVFDYVRWPEDME